MQTSFGLDACSVVDKGQRTFGPPLDSWHDRQFATKAFASVTFPHQVKYSVNAAPVVSPPLCPVCLAWTTEESFSFMSSAPFGIHIFPFNRKSPASSFLRPFCYLLLLRCKLQMCSCDGHSAGLSGILGTKEFPAPIVDLATICAVGNVLRYPRIQRVTISAIV